MMNIFYKTDNKKKLATLDKFNSATWVNLAEPNEDEIEEAVTMLGVDKGLLMDALDIYEMPRLEVEDNVLYIYIRVPEKKNDNIITRPLLIAIGRDFILTVCDKKCSLLDDYISSKKDFFTDQKANLLLKIIFDNNQKYNTYLIDINRRLRSIKVRLESVNAKDLVQFVDFEQVLNDFLSACISIDAMLQKILTGRYLEIGEADQDLLEDNSLSNKQLIELSKSSLRYTVNIRDTYSNIATHNLNRIMKILTVLTILLTVPNVIFGFFGMNVSILGSQSPHAYIYIIISTFCFLLLLLYIFIKEKWLQ